MSLELIRALSFLHEVTQRLFSQIFFSLKPKAGLETFLRSFELSFCFIFQPRLFLEPFACVLSSSTRNLHFFIHTFRLPRHTSTQHILLNLTSSAK